MTPQPGPPRARVVRGRALLGGIAATALAVVVAVVVTAPAPSSPQPAVGCTVVSASGSRYTVTPEQAQNAAIIAAVALRMGLPDHAATVALAASLQETQLRVLDYGDRDSLGLFQQRPSQGWGTPAQVMDPDYAATAFYQRLAKVDGWQTMTVTVAAQSVQHSATPDAYGVWEDEARALARALTGEVPAGLTCTLGGFGGAAPPPSAIEAAATTELGGALLGQVVPAKTGWALAAWAVAHAYDYHLQAVTFDGWTWRAATGRWARVTGVSADRVTVT